MKKSYLMVAVTASMLAFTACSNDEEATKMNEDSTTQTLIVQVASAGDGLTTRAGRPLYSSAAAQDIDYVKVVVYAAGGKIAYEKNLGDWKTISKAYTTNGHGLQYTLTLKGADKLVAGTYTVLAVGYANNSDYTYSPLLTSLTKDASYTAPITATIGTGKEVEEVFAGEAALTVPAENDQAFNAPVTLHRQVAGGFGYFKNIPAAVDGNTAKTLRLVASAKNTAVEFKNFNGTFTEASNGVQYIVNGTTPATEEAGILFSDATTKGYVVYSIDLSTWFPNGDTDNNGILNNSDNGWVNPTAGLSVVKGSVFAGKFIIPFGYVDGKNTMELQLLASDGSIIKHWTVKVPAVAPDVTAPQVKDQSVNVYNVVRNHMYNIGVKVANPTDPTEPEEKPDVEVPEDLSKGQDLILKVNDNWELIHQMELE